MKKFRLLLTLALSVSLFSGVFAATGDELFEAKYYYQTA